MYKGAEQQLDAAMERIERRREDDVIYGRNQPVIPCTLRFTFLNASSMAGVWPCSFVLFVDEGYQMQALPQIHHSRQWMITAINAQHKACLHELPWQTV